MLKDRRRNIHWVDINMAELELEKLILHYSQSNRADGKSPKTISWYTEMLTTFNRFLTATGKNLILSELNINSAREFVIHEQERGMSPYTVQGKVRALKAFASWLYREGYTSDHVLYNLKLPKAPGLLGSCFSSISFIFVFLGHNLLLSFSSQSTTSKGARATT
ncbi:phage integrase SAM-like domain-containing protein [Chloroflexota bacterium]